MLKITWEIAGDMTRSVMGGLHLQHHSMKTVIHQMLASGGNMQHRATKKLYGDDSYLASDGDQPW